MGGWVVMLGIVVFVMLGQVVLWSWVFIQRQRKLPGVRVSNWDDIVVWAKDLADGYYRAMGRR
ncbi:MAG: hypothetical protein HGA65_13615 [Oscillochloris sp.]|nr:hypothetical protein [Oscillochloris sp.]